MLYILAGITGTIGFMVLGMLAKRLRNRDVHSRSIMGIYSLTAPAWLLLLIILAARGQLSVASLYLLLLGAWLGVCFLFNYASLYISRFQSLSESIGYRFGLTVACAYVADRFIFAQAVEGWRLAAATLTFIGGLILSFSRQTVDPARHMPLPKRLPFLIVLSVLEVAMYALFKAAGARQGHAIANIAATQVAIFGASAVLGLGPLRRDYAAGKVPPRMIALMAGIVMIAAFAEGTAIGALPVTIIELFSVIGVAVYAIHDMTTREIRPSAANITGVALIMAGVGWIAVLGRMP